MPVDFVLSAASGVISGFFGLTAIVFGVQKLVDFTVKPFAKDLRFTRAVTWTLGTCLVVMVFYEVGFVWTYILSPDDSPNQAALMKTWIVSSAFGFMLFAFVPFFESKLRRKGGLKP